ncbi:MULTISPECIES: tetratricopeptide repeat protein [Actinosynnema]|uniref:tetratricopeptide repeat protein n=1 Tax=Actinosynnema TaxID=40566 RepID=UPI0020A2A922|nr:tetratricopeptide repeat protein [Actinosynnema pretiosum]MCP2096401.1 Tetratricopeptide repeat-containing protein [Actinosynnema pretiosum]
MITDPVLLRVAEAAQLNHGQGRRADARVLLDRLWAEIGGERGDPLHVCVLAHTMADVHDDVREELRWDERALAAADLLGDERTASAGVALPVAALRPSLHLNLADCHRKLGDLERAREHLERAREHVDLLGDDDYGRVIRDGLARLAERLAAG